MTSVHVNTVENIRPIEGFPDYYIDSNGVVYTTSVRYRNRLPDGFVRPMGGHAMPKGYHQVILCNGPGVRRRALVHRLVLEAFVGPCPDGMECRHLDGNPANNRLDNLCWGTPAENAADKKKGDTGIYGTKHPLAKLNDKGVAGARALVAIGWSHREVAEFFHVSRSAITLAVSGKSWKHV